MNVRPHKGKNSAAETVAVHTELESSPSHLCTSLQEDSLFSLVKGCTDAIYSLISEANNVHQIIASGTGNESPCFLTELVPVDTVSHQPMKMFGTINSCLPVIRKC